MQFYNTWCYIYCIYCGHFGKKNQKENNHLQLQRSNDIKYEHFSFILVTHTIS